MKRYITALISVLIIIVPLAISELASPRLEKASALTQDKPKGDVEAGKQLYKERCEECHGDKGQGVPKMYRLVKATIVHLGSKEAQDKSDDFIRKSMTDGYNKMEPITDPRKLTPEEVENILAFVRTLKQE